jgi:hypothetical protein
MNALLEAIQDVVIGEPETEAQPDPTQPDDGAIETQLTNQISSLWVENTRLSADRKATTRELRQIRASLAERLYEMKSLLSRPGRGGEWRGWLREQGIPRSSADRLCARHGETLDIENGNVPSGAITEQEEANADKLAKSVWQRFGKFLSIDEAAFQFIDRIAELSGVGHERRAEGLLILNPAPKPSDELPATAPEIDPAPQPSEEVSVITEEPIQDTAAAPTELGLAVAAAETSNGDVV